MYESILSEKSALITRIYKKMRILSGKFENCSFEKIHTKMFMVS